MENIIKLIESHSLLFLLVSIMCSYVLHIIADFNLQGILAYLKQKEWWKENCPQKLYKNDWREALGIHSVEWSIITFVPIYFILSMYELTDKFKNSLEIRPIYLILIVFGTNSIIHAIVDHFKSNKHSISLKTDQFIHRLQIYITNLAIFLILIK